MEGAHQPAPRRVAGAARDGEEEEGDRISRLVPQDRAVGDGNGDLDGDTADEEAGLPR